MSKYAFPMDEKVAKEIIIAGFTWANWNDTQKKAFQTAISAINMLEQLEVKYKMLNKEWLELATFKQVSEKILSKEKFEEIEMATFSSLEK